MCFFFSYKWSVPFTYKTSTQAKPVEVLMDRGDGMVSCDDIVNPAYMDNNNNVD